VSNAPSAADEVERYLRTGETDPHHAAWPGAFMERANRAHEEPRGALVREVRRRAEGLAHQSLPHADTVAITRGKAEPMVRGLFPRVEQDAVLATLETSVVFVTSANIEPLLLEHGYDSSAWTLANLYLGWTRARSQTSSRRRRAHGTAGRSSSRGALQRAVRGRLSSCYGRRGPLRRLPGVGDRVGSGIHACRRVGPARRLRHRHPTAVTFTGSRHTHALS
jgi:hypothetical protein